MDTFRQSVDTYVEPPKYSPIQQRILNLLSDGLPHGKKEIYACMTDDLVDIKTMYNHLSRLRKRLKPLGQDIVCEYYKRSFCYRHIILLSHIPK